MNIAFWSPTESRQEAYLTALSAVTATVRFACRVIVVENYVTEKNLGYLLLGPRYRGIRMNYRQFGAQTATNDTFLRFVSKETGRKVRGQRSLEIIPDSLYFLPMNQSLSKDVYEYGFMEELPEITEYCRDNYDAVFWNLEGRGNMTTPRILEHADRVIVALPGTWREFERFYEEYKSIINKSIVLIKEQTGEMLSTTGLVRRIKRKYPFMKGRVFPLPMSNELRCAVADGKVVEYICEHFDDKKISKEYEVIHSLRNLVGLLLGKTEKQSGNRYWHDLHKDEKNSSFESPESTENEELWVADHY